MVWNIYAHLFSGHDMYCALKLPTAEYAGLHSIKFVKKERNTSTNIPHYRRYSKEDPLPGLKTYLTRPMGFAGPTPLGLREPGILNTYLGLHDVQLSGKRLEVCVEVNIAHYLCQLLSLGELALVQVQEDLLREGKG